MEELVSGDIGTTNFEQIPEDIEDKIAEQVIGCFHGAGINGCSKEKAHGFIQGIDGEMMEAQDAKSRHRNQKVKVASCICADVGEELREN